MNAWLILITAGLLEIAWAVGLKYSQGFSRPVVSLITIIAMIASMFLLSLSLKKLPLGTAYAVWVGIGIVGSSICGILLWQESTNLWRILSIFAIFIGIIGLKLTA
ncbi:MAG: quaternary ammonium compound efflux SMR transporter SugE [Neisseriaceae bacterium]|nr:quaternary ammonium compound efflux SMR transporter SugE [Neisseriaceae bacterium]MBQ9182615.1 quaternary ammonium compound efflux SMR transporter SugE [Neisseriaceae bacterium]